MSGCSPSHRQILRRQSFGYHRRWPVAYSYQLAYFGSHGLHDPASTGSCQLLVHQCLVPVFFSPSQGFSPFSWTRTRNLPLVGWHPTHFSGHALRRVSRCLQFKVRYAISIRSIEKTNREKNSVPQIGQSLGDIFTWLYCPCMRAISVSSASRRMIYLLSKPGSLYQVLVLQVWSSNTGKK